MGDAHEPAGSRRSQDDEVVGDSMLRNKDDQIGLQYQSFNRFEHYVHGERKCDGVPDLTQNLRIDYSIFGTAY